MERVIIAIETSTKQGSVALWADGEIKSERFFFADRSHNSAIFDPLAEILDVAGGRIDSVIAGTGPGSYTGARVGIAAGQGVAMVRGAEFRGVASVCAADVVSDSYAVVGDARRGSFFWVEVRERKIAGEIEVMVGRDALDQRVSEAGLETITFDESVDWVDLSRPVAAKLAIGAAQKPDDGAVDLVEPIYLGAPFVTKPKRAAVWGKK